MSAAGWLALLRACGLLHLDEGNRRKAMLGAGGERAGEQGVGDGGVGIEQGRHTGTGIEKGKHIGTGIEQGREGVRSGDAGEEDRALVRHVGVTEMEGAVGRVSLRSAMWAYTSARPLVPDEAPVAREWARATHLSSADFGEALVRLADMLPLPEEGTLRTFCRAHAAAGALPSDVTGGTLPGVSDPLARIEASARELGLPGAHGPVVTGSLPSCVCAHHRFFAACRAVVAADDDAAADRADSAVLVGDLAEAALHQLDVQRSAATPLGAVAGVPSGPAEFRRSIRTRQPHDKLEKLVHLLKYRLRHTMTL